MYQNLFKERKCSKNLDFSEFVFQTLLKPHFTNKLLVSIFKGELIHYQGRQLSKLILLPSEKGSTQNKKNLLPRGKSRSFLEYTSFQKGIGLQEIK